MPSMSRRNEPDTPGRIMAQMAMAPDTKKIHGAGSLTSPLRRPSTRNATTATPATMARRRPSQPSTSPAATMMEPTTSPKKVAAISTGWSSSATSMGWDRATMATPMPTPRGTRNSHSTALSSSTKPFGSPRTRRPSAWAPVRTLAMSRV